MLLNCPYCDFSSQRSDGLQRHLQSAHPNLSEDEVNQIIGKKPCKSCGKYEYTRYMRNGYCKDCAGKEKGSVCPICGVSRKNLGQHLHKAHKDISKEEYCRIMGIDSKCPICGKPVYSWDVTHRGLCDECFEKYHVNCHICGYPIVWGAGEHYGKAHGVQPPDDFGTLQEWFCTGCGKSLGFKRVLNRDRCDPMDKVCPECQKNAVVCPSCGKPILRNKNFFAHVLYCHDNSEETISSYVHSLPESEVKTLLLGGLEKFEDQSRRGTATVAAKNLGKNFDEIFGVEKSKDIRSRISNTMKENGTGWMVMRDPNRLPITLKHQAETRRKKYNGNWISDKGRQSISARMKVNNPLFGKSLLELQETGVINHNRTKYSQAACDFFERLDFALNLTGSHFGPSEWVIQIPDEYGFSKKALFLDYYNPAIQLAIEYDGWYWHSERKIQMRAVSDETRNSLIRAILKPRYFFAVPEEQAFEKFAEIVRAVTFGERQRLCEVLNQLLMKKGTDFHEDDHARTVEQICRKA